MQLRICAYGRRSDTAPSFVMFSKSVSFTKRSVPSFLTMRTGPTAPANRMLHIYPAGRVRDKRKADQN